MTSYKLPRTSLILGCVLIVALAGLSSARLWAQGGPVCGPSPAVQAALDQVPSNQTPDQTDYVFEQSRESAIQALLRQYPDDVFVQRSYIQVMSDPDAKRDRVIAQYKALHEQRPDDPRVSYLYGLTLVGRDSPQAIKLFRSALQKAPDFPWPHLQLVSIYSSPNFLDKAQAAAHAKSFLSECPDTLEGYEPLARMDDRDLIGKSAATLRQILEPRSDPKALEAYSTLWSLEFKAHSPAEYAALRKQIAADLERIRALNLQNERRWWEALQEGYKLTNDQKQSDWAEDEGTRRFPSSDELPAMTRWRKDHQAPGDDAAADKKRAYYSELLKQTDDWVKERPNTTFIWYYRLGAMEHLDDVPAAQVEACLDKTLQVAEANAGPWLPYVYFEGAEVLSRKGLQPEREVEMAQKGLERLEVEAKQPPDDLRFTKEFIDYLNFYNADQRAQGVFYEADGDLRLKQPEKTQLAIAQLDERVADLKSLVADKDDRRKSYAADESSYWGAMARLAELQNHKLDAMGYYESALLDRLDSGQLPAPGKKDELGEGAHQLWASLGGTDEGWKTWYGRRADALANKATLTWETSSDPLPPFQLTDLKGKTWQIADLKGKVVFLNFWASW